MADEIKRILRLRDVIEVTGLSRSTIYLYISTNRFPAPINLGGRRIGWPDTLIKQWIDSIIGQA
ncbi:MAG: helix-turn-helix transcriptional regulator [Micavibrio sp.]